MSGDENEHGVTGVESQKRTRIIHSFRNTSE